MGDEAAFGQVPAMQGQMLRFVRLLRDNGFSAGVSEAADAVRALGRTHATDPSEARHVLRTLFASREREWHRFDELFDAFWLGRMRYKRTSLQSAARGRRDAGQAAAAKHVTLADFFDWSAKGKNTADSDIAATGRSGGASTAESSAKA